MKVLKCMITKQHGATTIMISANNAILVSCFYRLSTAQYSFSKFLYVATVNWCCTWLYFRVFVLIYINVNAAPTISRHFQSILVDSSAPCIPDALWSLAHRRFKTCIILSKPCTYEMKSKHACWMLHPHHDLHLTSDLLVACRNTQNCWKERRFWGIADWMSECWKISSIKARTTCGQLTNCCRAWGRAHLKQMAELPLVRLSLCNTM